MHSFCIVEITKIMIYILITCIKYFENISTNQIPNNYISNMTA